MAQQKCKGIHEYHICTLAEKKEIEAIKRLASNPQYICVNCGRVADYDDNLCNPADIDLITIMR